MKERERKRKKRVRKTEKEWALGNKRNGLHVIDCNIEQGIGSN